MNRLVKLVCPKCKRPVQEEADGVGCPDCHRHFTYNQGVLSFLSPEERFNETPFEEHQIGNWTQTAQLRQKIRSSKLLSLINDLRIRCSLSGRRDRIFVQAMRHPPTPNPLILDLGCGGGRHYFCRFGTVIGIDPVLPLLVSARQLYAEVYQSSGFSLPFADDSFDYVVSTDVIGHIEEEHKDLLFSEIYRVLKKGGRTVHCSEALGDSPWWRFARKYPDLFQTYFIDRPGHVGMELPSVIRERFRRHGFREIRFRKLSSLIQEPGALTALFDNEYRQHCRVLNAAVAVDKVLGSNLLVKEMLNLILEPLAQVDDALTPLDYAGGVLTVHEK